MSITPGYSFSLTEEVTATKLTKWLVNSYVDTPFDAVTAGLAVEALSTGPTAVSLAEAKLFYNSSTGNIEIQTIWGHCPLLGGSKMFTRRFANYWETGDTQEQRFYGPVQLGVEDGASSYSCADTAMEADWWNYAPARVGGIQQQGNFGAVAAGSFYPTLDNPGTGYTETAWAPTDHRCVQLRGWTPMIYSAVSQYTNAYMGWDYRSMKGGTTYDQGPDVYGNGTAIRSAQALCASYAGWSGKYLLYLEPCLPSISYAKGNLLKNARV